MTSGRAFKILIVEPDPDLVAMLVGTLATSMNAHLTCVAGAAACLDTELVDPHDLVITELSLPVEHGIEEVTDGIGLAESLCSLSSRPIILLADRPTARQTIRAMRAGVRDVFIKPFTMEALADAAARMLHGFDLRRRHFAKYHKMRDLVRRVIRERRELNERVELVCRDLVGAHRRLAHRVLETEQSRPTGTT